MVVDAELIRKLRLPVRELELSIRCSNVFKDQGIEYIGDLVTKRKRDLLLIPNFGQASLKQAEYALKMSFDLSLEMYVPDWDEIRDGTIKSVYKERFVNAMDGLIETLVKYKKDFPFGTNNDDFIRTLIIEKQKLEGK